MDHHPPFPNHCHDDSSYSQCLVHGAQRALVHGELFSPVPSQSRDLYTPSTRLYGRIPYLSIKTSPPSIIYLTIMKLEAAEEKKDLLAVLCLGPQAEPDSLRQVWANCGPPQEFMRPDKH
ncbi:hypothetical protein E2C01_038036 [Portunus trituberculatus]|uniref:Uncharacterized protein n=1 Tax=Portunus trituberculatus TaxID=210409 RepID=A0A5B7FGX0_PORTR|nr:hypothetical protein [Portunus trituberculatus]